MLHDSRKTSFGVLGWRMILCGLSIDSSRVKPDISHNLSFTSTVILFVSAVETILLSSSVFCIFLVNSYYQEIYQICHLWCALPASVSVSGYFLPCFVKVKTASS